MDDQTVRHDKDTSGRDAGLAKNLALVMMQAIALTSRCWPV